MNTEEEKIWEGRHPSVAHFKDLFRFDHLPDGQFRAVSAHSTNLAFSMLAALKDGPELTTGLRKLLEAKDCFVRQSVIDRIERT